MEKVSHPPAPLWRRVAAMLYDSLLVLALVFLVAFINLGIQILIYGERQLMQMTQQGHTLDGLPFYGVLLVTIYGFFGFFWTRSGQTLGMQAWRIKIINPSGASVTPLQTLVRFTTAFFSLALAGIGLLWVLMDQQKRSWQDISSSTRTVLLPK